MGKGGKMDRTKKKDMDRAEEMLRESGFWDE